MNFLKRVFRCLCKRKNARATRRRAAAARKGRIASAVRRLLIICRLRMRLRRRRSQRSRGAAPSQSSHEEQEEQGISSMESVPELIPPTLGPESNSIPQSKAPLNELPLTLLPPCTPLSICSSPTLLSSPSLTSWDTCCSITSSEDEKSVYPDSAAAAAAAVHDEEEEGETEEEEEEEEEEEGDSETDVDEEDEASDSAIDDDEDEDTEEGEEGEGETGVSIPPEYMVPTNVSSGIIADYSNEATTLSRTSSDEELMTIFGNTEAGPTVSQWNDHVEATSSQSVFAPPFTAEQERMIVATNHPFKQYVLQYWDALLESCVQQNCSHRDEMLSRTSSEEELMSIFGLDDTDEENDVADNPQSSTLPSAPIIASCGPKTPTFPPPPTNVSEPQQSPFQALPAEYQYTAQSQECRHTLPPKDTYEKEALYNVCGPTIPPPPITVHDPQQNSQTVPLWNTFTMAPPSQNITALPLTAEQERATNHQHMLQSWATITIHQQHTMSIIGISGTNKNDVVDNPKAKDNIYGPKTPNVPPPLVTGYEAEQSSFQASQTKCSWFVWPRECPPTLSPENTATKEVQTNVSEHKNQGLLPPPNTMYVAEQSSSQALQTGFVWPQECPSTHFLENAATKEVQYNAWEPKMSDQPNFLYGDGIASHKTSKLMPMFDVNDTDEENDVVNNPQTKYNVCGPKTTNLSRPPITAHTQQRSSQALPTEHSGFVWPQECPPTLYPDYRAVKEATVWEPKTSDQPKCSYGDGTLSRKSSKLMSLFYVNDTDEENDVVDNPQTKYNVCGPKTTNLSRPPITAHTQQGSSQALPTEHSGFIWPQECPSTLYPDYRAVKEATVWEPKTSDQPNCLDRDGVAPCKSSKLLSCINDTDEESDVVDNPRQAKYNVCGPNAPSLPPPPITVHEPQQSSSQTLPTKHNGFVWPQECPPTLSLTDTTTKETPYNVCGPKTPSVSPPPTTVSDGQSSLQDKTQSPQTLSSKSKRRSKPAALTLTPCDPEPAPITQDPLTVSPPTSPLTVSPPTSPPLPPGPYTTEQRWNEYVANRSTSPEYFLYPPFTPEQEAWIVQTNHPFKDYVLETWQNQLHSSTCQQLEHLVN